MRQDARRILLLLFALAGSGCAGNAVRPPTPARNLDVEPFLTAPHPKHEHYYILVFGSQPIIRIPRYTHTWATAVKTSEPPGEPPRILDVQTISWMPADLVVKPLRFKVETGVNLSLYATLRETHRHGERISLWGPYEIWRGLYERFTTQKAFLDSGAIGYQCTDGFGEAAKLGNGSNCFHAISDIDPKFDRRQYPLLFYGDPASENIARQMLERPAVIQPCVTHDWLVPALGIDQCPIVRRHLHGRMPEFSPEANRAANASGAGPRRRLLFLP